MSDDLTPPPHLVLEESGYFKPTEQAPQCESTLGISGYGAVYCQGCCQMWTILGARDYNERARVWRFTVPPHRRLRFVTRTTIE